MYNLFSVSSQLGLAAEKGGLPDWVWLVIILVFLLILFLLLVTIGKKKGPSTEVEVKEEPVVVKAEPVKPVTPDNLAKVEGIGPKINSVLQEAGVKTFADLAAMEVSKVDEIIDAAGIRIADPTTWPEQAKLAAEGKWDELQVLQDNLKGGKKV